MSILRCHNLCKYYDSGSSVVHAVDKISVSFDEDEFCAITGASGSGKSTLLQMLGGIECPTQGEVFFKDENLYNYNDDILSVLRRRRFGFVFQSYNLMQELTAYENIILPVLLDKKKPDKAHIDMITSMLGINDRLTHLPSALSGGQQQRVAIARALSAKPSVVFADEPTGNLDAESSTEVLELLKQINKELKITLILVTHDLNIAAQANRVITLKDGRIENDTAGNTNE